MVLVQTDLDLILDLSHTSLKLFLSLVVITNLKKRCNLEHIKIGKVSN
jgi:hypothetical protein